MISLLPEVLGLKSRSFVTHYVVVVLMSGSKWQEKAWVAVQIDSCTWGTWGARTLQKAS